MALEEPRIRGRPPVARVGVETALRKQIVSGQYPPGERVPSVVELARTYHVSPTTIQQVLSNLTDDGFVLAQGTRGTFVTQYPPHLCRYAILNPLNRDNSGNRAESNNSEAIEESARMLQCEDPRRKMVFYRGINGDYERNDEYYSLLREIHADRLAGAIFISPPYELRGTPLLRMPGLPRVAFTWELLVSMPEVVIIPTDARAWMRGAMERIKRDRRKRVAMLAQPSALTIAELFHAEAAQAGLITHPYWVQHVYYRPPIASHRAVELLFSGPPEERPDALILSDDHYAAGAVAGLASAGVRAPQDVTVVSTFNYPNTQKVEFPIAWYGFDRRESVRLAIGVIDAIRAGRKPEPCTIIPRWLEDIV